VFDINNATLHGLLPCAELSWVLTYQAVPAIATRRSSSSSSPSSSTTATGDGSGGVHAPNALGLDAADGPLVLVLLSAFWHDAADDARVDAAARRLVARVRRAAARRGLARAWIYLNYAAPWQDPIAGYGAANRRRLQDISRRYDPHGVFQKNVPGGFKLFR
jgi:FAD/FMN-containing dehydrogenase